jgi:hypothetical protein
MQRMDGEEGRHKGASPGEIGHTRKNDEEEKGAYDMEKQIDEMRAGRVRGEELAVDHVGKPCKRMPVIGIHRAERPGNPASGQPSLHVAILGYVFVVVVADEVKTAHLPEHGNRDDYKKKRNKEIAVARFQFTHKLLSGVPWSTTF